MCARPVVEVKTYIENGNICVTINDNGEGMNENALKRIFEPFHTTKVNGTGLGLAVSHKIVENHEGKIFVESSQGGGSTFTLEFPAANSSLEKGLNPVDHLSIRKRG